jgi:hypothetical protein
MIRRSTQLIREIVKIVATVTSSAQIKRRRGLFDVPMMWRSGVRFTALQDMI